jgi:hypothetical protein
VKSILITFVVLALVMLRPASLEAERKTVNIKRVTIGKGVVNIAMDVEGEAGFMECFLNVPRCVAPPPGKYMIATDETGGYQHCADDVGLFPENSQLTDNEKIGTYCLEYPADRTVYSCPVNLTDLAAGNSTIPFVTMSVKNNSNKVVTAVEIGYTSMDRVGGFTTAKQSLPVENTVKPGESFRFSTIGAAEQILDHLRKSNGVGLKYFLQEVTFADGSKWNAEPVLHLCGVMDEDANKAFPRYSASPFR